MPSLQRADGDTQQRRSNVIPVQASWYSEGEISPLSFQIVSFLAWVAWNGKRLVIPQCKFLMKCFMSVHGLIWHLMQVIQNRFSVILIKRVYVSAARSWQSVTRWVHPFSNTMDRAGEDELVNGVLEGDIENEVGLWVDLKWEQNENFVGVLPRF